MHAKRTPATRTRRWTLPFLLIAVSLLFGGITVDRLLAREGTYSYLKLFNEVLLLVRNNYVEQVEVSGLMRGAYDGMLQALDPESEYVTRDQYQRLMASREPDEGNVGLELRRRGGYLFVVSVIPGSPADVAGLRTGTRVRRINGRSTREMTVTESILLLRGPIDTPVDIQLFPSRDGDPDSVTLERTRIEISGPQARRVERTVVLQVRDFSPGAASDARKILKQLELQDRTTVLLDLRGAAVGDYEEAAKLASLFVAGGELGRIVARDGEENILKADGDALAPEGRLGVLVDMGTSGPGELVAHALRVRREAEILGARTFGLASLQEFISLDNGSMLRLSVARCLGPEGETWERKGLEPDQPVVLEDDAEPRDGDGVLERALELLEGEPEVVPQAA